MKQACEFGDGALLMGELAASFARRFVGLETAAALVLAVSGGPDSMALMWMAARWAAERGPNAPRLHVATVDHGLRAEARAEADLVAAAAGRLGLTHERLAWTGPKPTTRIQELARTARYALLADFARSIGARHVLAAHHADDQAETILMRIGRGSGIGGLAGMRRETPLADGVTLVRPLLDVPKAALVALCRTEMIAVVEDPTNRDPAYARTRLRHEAERLEALGLDRRGLARLARRAARAEAALEAETDRAATALATSETSQACTLTFTRHRDLQPEIVLRLLRRAIARAVPTGAPIRLERLEALCEAVSTGLREKAAHRATLGGALVSLGSNGVLDVTAAPPRSRRLPQAITPSSTLGLD